MNFKDLFQDQRLTKILINYFLHEGRMATNTRRASEPQIKNEIWKRKVQFGSNLVKERHVANCDVICGLEALVYVAFP